MFRKAEEGPMEVCISEEMKGPDGRAESGSGKIEGRGKGRKRREERKTLG